MKEKSAKLIEEAADELGYDTDIREDYSGRWMFGKTTHAIVVDTQSNFVGAVAFVAVNMDNDTEESDDFIEDMQNIHFDSMGISIIAY